MTVGRALILDDDIDVANLMADIVRRTGHEAKVTTEPVRFFELVESWQPDCLVLDLIMPELDGVEIMSRLADAGCNARIIVVSGADKRITASAARSAGERGLDVAATLAKPFSTQTLANLVLHTFYLGSPLPSFRQLLRSAGDGSRERFEISFEGLREALEGRQIELTFQPQICCNTRALRGFETLARWHHPEAGYLSPTHFIPAFERHGLMPDLTRSVVSQALDWFSGLEDSLVASGRNHAKAWSPLSLSVNVSTSNLGDMGFADELQGLCRGAKVSPDQLVLELSQSDAMDDSVVSLDLLTRLRVQGFHLSLDDFSSGHSTMHRLVRLPFSEIKVDKRFVTTVTSSDESRSVVRSIVELGNSLGLRSVAEGVEDQETLDYLHDLGCDRAQGYYICSPLPGNEIVPWLWSRN